MRQNLQKLYTRLLAICLAVLLIFAQIPVVIAAETSGTCGNNLNWSFSDHQLTITGSGDMTDYNQIKLPPWYEFRDQIFYLALPEGLLSIGDMAFYDCTKLTAVTLPTTVKEVGILSFSQCRSMSILKLNDGLLTIGRSAFGQCEDLRDLRIPNTVTKIEYHAFCECYALRYVSIPESVTEMGAGVFEHCKNLVRAEIAAPIEVIPSLTFYGCSDLFDIVIHEQIKGSDPDAFTGCESLNIVYYSGDGQNAANIREQISDDEESFRHFGVVLDSKPATDGSIVGVEEQEDGYTILQTTVSKTESSTVSTTSATKKDETGATSSAEITATIITEEGWQELVNAILAAQKDLSAKKNNGDEVENVDVNVYVAENSGVPSDVLNVLVDNNVNMTIQAEDGSKFAVNGSTLETTTEEQKVRFSYSAIRMANPDHQDLNGSAVYKLKFSSSSNMKVEVLIRIPESFARKTATLYVLEGKKLTLLQSVLVDTVGYAHFYLANVDASAEYRIGIDVPNVDKSAVIIPSDLHAEYGVTDMVFASDMYVITGRQSAWGVNMTQVTIMLMAVMVVSAVAVGVFMYIRNKKKLAAGYVPDISEEDLEEE